MLAASVMALSFLAGTAGASNATLKATLDRWSTTMAADARAVSLAARQRHPRAMTAAALRFRRDALLARAAIAARRPSTAKGKRAKLLALTADTDYARAGAKWAASGRARVARRLVLAAADARVAAAYARAGNRLLVTAGTLLG